LKTSPFVHTPHNRLNKNFHYIFLGFFFAKDFSTICPGFPQPKIKFSLS
jgi:hypothetical protein